MRWERIQRSEASQSAGIWRQPTCLHCPEAHADGIATTMTGVKQNKTYFPRAHADVGLSASSLIRRFSWKHLQAKRLQSSSMSESWQAFSQYPLTGTNNNNRISTKLCDALKGTRDTRCSQQKNISAIQFVFCLFACFLNILASADSTQECVDLCFNTSGPCGYVWGSQTTKRFHGQFKWKSIGRTF